MAAACAAFSSSDSSFFFGFFFAFPFDVDVDVDVVVVGFFFAAPPGVTFVLVDEDVFLVVFVADVVDESDFFLTPVFDPPLLLLGVLTPSAASFVFVVVVGITTHAHSVCVHYALSLY